MTSGNLQPMAAQDWFGVGVRFVALFSLYTAFQNLLFFVDLRAGWTMTRSAVSDSAPEGYLLYVVGYGSLGLALLTNASGITQLAYPPKSSEGEKTQEAEISEE